MALSADRNTNKREGSEYSYPVAALKLIYQGALVVLDSAGNAEPGTTATGKVAVGRANARADNSSGLAAAINVSVEAGVFYWANSSGDAVTKANIGDTVYIEDDQTVCATATGKSAAGVMVDIDANGVYVETKPPVSLVSGLTAANNLSDVGSAATARTNLGVGTGDSPTFADVTTTDDVTVGDDLVVSGLCTIAETLAVTQSIVGLQKYDTKTSTYTVVNAADGDMIIEDATDNAVITLPDCAAGNKGQRLTVINSAASGAAKLSISPHSSDKIVGTIQAVDVTGVADKDIINTKATAVKGDYAVLVSDGVDTWYVIGGVGVWAGE